MLKGIKKIKPEEEVQEIQKKDEALYTEKQLKQQNEKILNLYLSGNSEELQKELATLSMMEEKYFSVSQNPQQEEVKKEKQKFDYELDFEEKDEETRIKKKKPKYKSVKTQDYCVYCPENEELTLLSASNFVYLALPKIKTFRKYPHLILAPVQHQQTMIGLDDHILQELNNYKKCLIQMYDQMNLHVVFLQQFCAQNSHIFIECLAIPPKKVYDMPFFFKQSLEQVEGYWTTHKNIIQIRKEKGGIQKQIPKRIKYFYIDFGLGYGYAHVIQNEKFWKRDFCYEVIATTLGLERYEIKTTEQYSEEEVAKKVKDFEEKWKDYNWTKLLEQ